MKNLSVALLSTLMMAQCMHGVLSIDDEHQPKFNVEENRLSSPTSIKNLALFFGAPLLTGGVTGSIVGACFSNESVGKGLIAGVIAGAIWGVYEYNGYSSVYEATQYDLHGAAANKDLKAVDALLAYHKGWYVFKGQTGDPVNTNKADQTALMVAAAFNQPSIINAICEVAPKEVQKKIKVGESTTKVDNTYRTSVGRSVSGSVTEAVAGALMGAEATNSFDTSTTSGGGSTTENYSTLTTPYVDLQDNAGKTAANFAVRVRVIEALRALIDRGADIGILDRTKQSVESIAVHDPQVMRALDKAKGK